MNKKLLGKKRLTQYCLINKYIDVKHEYVVWGIVLKIAIALLVIPSTQVYIFLVDEVFLKKNIEKIVFPIIGYIFIYILETFLAILDNNNNKRLICFLDSVSRSKILEKVLYSQNKVKPDELIEIVCNDSENIADFIIYDIIEFVAEFISMVILCHGLIKYSYILTIICLSAIVLNVYIMNKCALNISKITKRYREERVKINQKLQNILNNIDEIKLNNLCECYVEDIKKSYNIASQFYMKRQMTLFSNKLLIKIKDSFLLKVNLYIVGGALVLSSKIVLDSLLGFVNLFESLYKLVEAMMKNNADYSFRSIKIDKVIEIVSWQMGEYEKIYVYDGSITIDHIYFKYPDSSQFVYSDFSIRVVKGQHLALTGKVGTGKTTFIRLLSGIEKPDKGEIYIDGININKATIECGCGIVFLMQQACFLSLSIAQNFELACEGKKLSEIRQACRTVGIDEIIMSLPKQYDTILNKECALSGGELQKLAVARLLLTEAKIVVLDEFTSALDVKSEVNMLDIVKRYVKEKTVILVSHRKVPLELTEHILNLACKEIS